MAPPLLAAPPPTGATTLVWLSPQGAGDAQRRALDAWALERGLRLEPPVEGRTRPLPAAGPDVADAVEVQLDAARDALTAREGAGVERAVDTAESTLRAHPELPQAAWLMAELERVRALRALRVAPADPAAADLAWARATALDGGR